MTKILIVSARFYPEISNALEQGAHAVLQAAGAQVELIEVPGALEIPSAIRFALKKYDGFVALGCVMRGETYHFDIVCNESARGLSWLAIEYEAAIGNGILTVEDEAQANARLGKGRDAANACLELVNIKRRYA